MPKNKTPATGAPGGPQGNESRERQLSIVTQALFKTIYPVAFNNNGAKAEEVLQYSIKLAMTLEKEVKKAVAAQHMENAKQALENENLSQSQSTNIGAEEDFDDDISW